ncbi:MAG TPA: hypothetical protein VFT89_07415 [Rhizobiaceae bacterium]|nr:hypothetical protein [Rhizobiaceae bacterium]
MKLLTFYFDFIDENGFSPTPTDVHVGTGIHLSDIGSLNRVLAMKGAITMEKTTANDGKGRGFAVVEVCHPNKGETRLEPTFYDDTFGASYFAEDLASLPPKIERRCLCCRSKFEARGRFIRLCGVCRKEGEAMSPYDDGGYVSNALAVSWGNPAAGIGGFRRGTK